MRFLLSRRWIVFFGVVVALAYLAFRLGEWQFDRLEAREKSNAVTERNLAADPVPVESALAVDEPVSAEEEWLRVTAQGEYAADRTVVVRYQTRDGQSGVDVVTPLVTESGTALLVNRGWLATDNVGTTRPDVPAAPTGEVTVTGWVRADATGDSAAVADQSTRAVSSRTIGETLPFPVYGGFVELDSEMPSAPEPLGKVETPDLGEGPHFFYGLQWWFFASLAMFGFGYLVWDERRKLHRPTPAAPGQPRQRTGQSS
ncbi:MAG TPA: SURF1 family protein [Nocardioidaceae bacterium]|nr:SURF1 family protein [Nocardioidaceae bacterium]